MHSDLRSFAFINIMMVLEPRGGERKRDGFDRDSMIVILYRFQELIVSNGLDRLVRRS